MVFFRSEVVYQSPTLKIGMFRCHPEHPCFNDSGPARGHLMVFPRTTVRITQSGHRPLVADRNVVVFYNARQEYRREAISEQGDQCEWFCFPVESVAAAVARFDPDVMQRGERPFVIDHGWSDSGSYLQQRAIFNATRRDGIGASPLNIEESMLHVLDRCVASAFRIRGMAARRVTRATHLEHLEQVQEARLFLAGHFCERLTLDEIARYVCSSPFHLARLFRRHTGSTIHQYLLRLRLRAALDRLESSDTSLTSLALELGFASHSHFSTAFKAQYGQSPKRIQKEALKALAQNSSNNLKAID